MSDSQPRTRVVGYVRVSTDRQAEKGQSLEVQRAKLAGYCALYELDLVAVIEDAGQSAKSLDRPGLQRVLGMLRSGEADAIVVSKLDRLTRSVAGLGSLVETYFSKPRWALLSVGESLDTRTAAGRLVLNLLASVAQWEREVTNERTREGKRAKQAKGGFIGGAAPYGFQLQGAELVPVPHEQRAIELARSLRSEKLTLRRIVAKLSAAGFETRTGGPFQPVQVARMLRPVQTTQTASAAGVVAA